MNNAESSMIGMKPKDVIKLDIVPLDKPYSEETVLPKDGLYIYLYQFGEQHGAQKRRATDLIWSKTRYRLDRDVRDQVTGSCIICKMDLIELLYVKN